MSKVSIQGDQNGTGTFTFKAPATNTDRVFDLPDEAGTVLTNVSDIESQVKTATNATGSAPVYACRAWVNFDGTGTVSIRDSGNVSSITDDSTGVYLVNFTTAMPDVNYSVTSSSTDIVSTANQQFHIHDTGQIISNSQFRYGVRLIDNDNNIMSQADSNSCQVAVFR